MKAVVNQSITSLSQVREVMSLQRSYAVEIILPDGERRHFRSKNCSKKEAEKEILAYVASIETYLDKPVFWRYAGESVYRMGELVPKGMFVQRLKKGLLSFFELN